LVEEVEQGRHRERVSVFREKSGGRRTRINAECMIHRVNYLGVDVGEQEERRHQGDDHGELAGSHWCVCVCVVPLESGGRMEPALDWMEVSRELWRGWGRLLFLCGELAKAKAGQG